MISFKSMILTAKRVLIIVENARTFISSLMRVKPADMPMLTPTANIAIKLLSENATIPVYATPVAAGCDLFAAVEVIVRPGTPVKIPLKFAIALPPDKQMEIRPRSGMSSKTMLRVLQGTIDPDYRGPVHVVMDNIGTHGVKISVGDPIAQGVITPFYRGVFNQVGDLSRTERGTGGFGHTGMGSFDK